MKGRTSGRGRRLGRHGSGLGG